MVQRMLIWWVALVMAVFIGPITVVFVGGFYKPVLLESVATLEHKSSDLKSLDDFREEEVVRALAKSISPDSPIEAIKAQAVITRTYMLRRELGIVEEGELDGMTDDDMKKLWQENYDKILKIYESAAEATRQEVVFYEEELIEPVYHKESAGMTRDAMSLYNVEIPYLKPVESHYDTQQAEKVILKSVFKENLEAAYPNVLLDEQYIENQIQIVSRDSSGYIQSLQIGNILLTGEAFRELFELPSSAVTLSSQGDTLIFKTKGTGHGVGLSQNGAIQMAKEGKTYTEILMYYYTDVEIHKK